MKTETKTETRAGMGSGSAGKKVFVAMSGGVDSAVAALLMKRAGYDCEGVTLSFAGKENPCCGEREIADARRTAELLNIPHRVLSLPEAFRECVVEPFLRAYEAGLTPNPCVLCNASLKFGRLLALAEREGVSGIATGHYARIERENGAYRLKKGLDPQKDQSYVLYRIPRGQLGSIFFPLGGLTKDEVRKIAEENGFPAAHKKDSQDICFVPDGDYAAFIERERGKRFPEGEFVTEDGRVLGAHGGIIRYTVGQRKGLGLALPEPYYVKRKDAENNRVILCPAAGLKTTCLTADTFCWTSVDPPQAGTELHTSVRTRYHQQEQPAVLTVLENGRVAIRLEGEGAVAAPGQSAVAYDGDVLLGGGTIM